MHISNLMPITPLTRCSHTARRFSVILGKHYSRTSQLLHLAKIGMLICQNYYSAALKSLKSSTQRGEMTLGHGVPHTQSTNRILESKAQANPRIFWGYVSTNMNT